ncbi:hypothetical protein [Algoriphagus mannitolivorans]|uniref:hypothetical protein n=1 Tax=Algoriphagus mannitolivorans TaxID=226504 RepID=UPI00042A55C3|nr:hypothetical protein [Algoriphagus mannitolivorans]
MKIDLIIEKYKILELGLYKKGEKKPYLYNIEELFDEINTKFTGKSLINTKTFSKERYKNFNPVYILGFINENDYILFCTWNEIDSESNKVRAIKGSRKYGEEIKISTTDFQEDDILGVPAFFIIDKKKELIFSIKQKGVQYSGDTIPKSV